MVFLVGLTIVVIYSILKDAAFKSAQAFCPHLKPAEPQRPPVHNPAPAAAPVNPAPPVQLTQPPAPFTMPMLPPAPAYQPPQTFAPAFPGGNGRSVDPAKVAQVMAIMEELERRNAWQRNTNY